MNYILTKQLSSEVPSLSARLSCALLILQLLLRHPNGLSSVEDQPDILPSQGYPDLDLQILSSRSRAVYRLTKFSRTIPITVC